MCLTAHCQRGFWFPSGTLFLAEVFAFPAPCRAKEMLQNYLVTQARPPAQASVCQWYPPCSLCILGMFLCRLCSLFLSPLVCGKFLEYTNPIQKAPPPKLLVAGLLTHLTLTLPSPAEQNRPGCYSASCVPQFPYLQNEGTARWHHCCMLEISSRLSQRLSCSPGVSPGCGQGP